MQEWWTYDEATKVITGRNESCDLHEKGVGHLMYESLQANGDKIVQIDVTTGATDTCAGLLQRSTRLALKLKQEGVKPGDVISICSHNQIDCTVAFVGAVFVGAINASLDPTLSKEDILHLVKQVAPKVIFTSIDCEGLIDDVIQTMSSLPPKIVVFEGSDKNISFTDWIEPRKDVEEFRPYTPESLKETLVIAFSSGTTGMPKGLCLGHDYLLYNGKIMHSPAVLNAATLYWSTQINQLIGVLCYGGTRMIVKALDPIRVWDWIEKFKIESLTLPPHQVFSIISHRPKNFVSSLKLLCTIGSSTGLDLMLQFREAFPKTKVVSWYGQTECGALCHPFADISYNKPLSVGVPSVNSVYKVVDPESEENLGFNQIGEVRVKVKYPLIGYHNMDSSSIWDSEGFTKTGDLAYYDENFCFFLVDRVKEMFKYKGFHITPISLEEVLQQHPGVERAAVIGIPHPVDGNHVAAVVVLKPGVRIGSEEIKSFYNERVDDRKRLRGGVFFVDKVPLTPTGKVKRVALKEMILKVRKEEGRTLA